MLVANSFDLWKRDAFFSAAEEVQESADIMESVYRTWAREREEGLTGRDLDELCRELQTALGTAKWQLEEFERAVRLSYRNRSDDVTTTRHRQFVAAMENQINRVEAALRESFSEEGKQPLRWVNLDEEECDDLAAFLSGTPGTSQTMKDESAKLGASTKFPFQGTQYTKKAVDLNIKVPYNRDLLNQTNVVTSGKDTEYVIELEAKEISLTRDDMNCQADRIAGTRRTWSSPDIGAWKIVITDEDEKKKALMPIIEATPKEKGSKLVFWKQRCGDQHLARGGISSYTHLRGINWINQILGRVGGCQRQVRSPLHLQSSCHVKLTLALMLSIFLIGKLLIYLN
ncbi:hypothetical protein F0562_030596 [Nyssa sinensis]|uniref:Syntaxin 6/10/61 N-terminal domain-containing protein n=1 Tax=Nyssa sinensis TaxID=561372 RepID=A0A5J5AXC6_9ASTE|nr:hypothetical protein F0562_030596 [Nyssa sinensis]